jgi:hypothetical protein
MLLLPGVENHADIKKLRKKAYAICLIGEIVNTFLTK